MQAGKSTSILAFRYSSNHVFKCAGKHVGMYAGWHSCLHACTQSSSQACKYTHKSAGAQAVLSTNKKIFFQKKTEKGKKEKESNFKGRDADRQKGIGISPEGCLVRYEQGIMPKSFCQTVKARHTFGFFLLFLWIKYK